MKPRRVNPNAGETKNGKPATAVYFPSVREISDALRVHRDTITKHMARPGWPAKVPGKGWERAAIDAYFIEYKRQAAAHMAGPNTDLKRQKLEKEIERMELDIKLRQIEVDTAQGNLVPVADMLAEVRGITDIFQDALKAWIGQVKVLSADAKLVAEAERLRDRAYELVTERVRAKGET
jgi:hypothetical protein